MAENFPHHEALEAANDLRLALSFRRSAADVVDRGLMARCIFRRKRPLVSGSSALPMHTKYVLIDG
jgi:hypothetical protein